MYEAERQQGEQKTPDEQLWQEMDQPLHGFA
jgi:hypothetical protein